MMPRIEMTLRPCKHFMSFVDLSKLNNDVTFEYNEKALSNSFLFVVCLRDFKSKIVHKSAIIDRDKIMHLECIMINEWKFLK